MGGKAPDSPLGGHAVRALRQLPPPIKAAMQGLLEANEKMRGATERLVVAIAGHLEDKGVKKD